MEIFDDARKILLSINMFLRRYWLIFQFREVKNGTVEFYSLTLILAGAIGNLGERGWNLVFNDNGKVTDFVELLFIPSFNLADTYISFGIVLLLYSEIKNK